MSVKSADKDIILVLHPAALLADVWIISNTSVVL
jgi:hypothetical protein